jgi:hypothetical protein
MEQLINDIVDSVIEKIALNLSTSNAIAGGAGGSSKVPTNITPLKKSDEQTSHLAENPERPQDRSYTWAQKSNQNDMRTKQIGDIQ